MNTSITVLSTKKLTADQKRLWNKNALNLIEHDFISITSLGFEVDRLHGFLLLTSQNAVRSLLLHPQLIEMKSKPVFCVGVKTKMLLEQNGWRVLAWAHYAEELAPIIVSQYPSCAISFFNGNLRSSILPAAFQAAKINYNEFEVYRTDLTSRPINEKPDAICFYSPSGVYSFLKHNSLGDAVCFCIGKTTATALEKMTTRLILADHPTVEATLEACVTYYK